MVLGWKELLIILVVAAVLGFTVRITWRQQGWTRFR